LNPSLTGTDQGITYNVVGSADRIDLDTGQLVIANARDNALVEAPVYLTDGTFIADGFDDLWNTAMIDNKLLPSPINVTQFGVVDTTSSLTVATGTKPDGTISDDPLGNISGINEKTTLGNGLVRGPQWIDDVSGPNGPLVDYRFYGMSEKITVPTVVPLPAAVWLFGSALGLLAWGSRKSSPATKTNVTHEPVWVAEHVLGRGYRAVSRLAQYGSVLCPVRYGRKFSPSSALRCARTHTGIFTLTVLCSALFAARAMAALSIGKPGRSAGGTYQFTGIRHVSGNWRGCPAAIRPGWG
jgi:hypothetical protein